MLECQSWYILSDDLQSVRMEVVCSCILNSCPCRFEDAEMAALNKLADNEVETDEKREMLASVGDFVLNRFFFRETFMAMPPNRGTEY